MSAPEAFSVFPHPTVGSGPWVVDPAGRDPATEWEELCSFRPSADALGIRVERQRGFLHRAPLRLRLVGELCAYSAPLVADALRGWAVDDDVVLDLWRTTFIDAAGVSVCLDLGRRWRARGRTLHIANPSAPVCRVVSLLGLEDELFTSPRQDAAPVPEGETPPRHADLGVEVRNLERGQVIEVAVTGTIDGDGLAGLHHRLDTLAAKRQPATLRLDLSGATIELDLVDAVLDVTATLDRIGSHLVVIDGTPPLAPAFASRSDLRSLVFEHGPN